MAVDHTLALGTRQRTQADTFAEIGFVAFVLLVFVGLKPFAIRDVSLLPSGDSGTGAGDIWRQISYLACFATLVLSAWRQNGQRMWFAIPAALGALLAWCLASSLWAAAPDVTLRRAGLEIVIALSGMLGVQSVGADRSLAILRALLAAILVVNFASILLVPQAVHLPGEADPQLIGNWRGLYYHKNIAGAVCSISAILFFFRALETKSGWDWLLFVGAALFTFMTRSKTSLALLPVAVLAGVFFRQTQRNTLERWILLLTAAFAGVVAVMVLLIDFHTIGRILTDPQELTGRVAIWQGEVAFVRDHPLLGAGFGSFADTGTLSPLDKYVADKWVQGEAHGHNAYLQLFVTIGGIGFILAMLALIVQPLLAFRRMERDGKNSFFAPLFAIFVFIVLHNLAESDFLESDGPAWVAFLLMLACLHGRFIPAPRPATVLAPQWSVP